MKGNVKIYIFLFFFVFTIFFSNPFWNVVSMIEGEGYIPSMSSMFTFSVISFDEGSGGYWRYGEDSKYYYHFSLTEENVYFYIDKNNDCVNFNKFNFATWCSAIKIQQK